jgi:hypothetical protein
MRARRLKIMISQMELQNFTINNNIKTTTTMIKDSSLSLRILKKRMP